MLYRSTCGRSPFSDLSNTLFCCLMVIACGLLPGCSTLVKPEILSVPAKITCINVPEKISFSTQRGLLKVKWDTSLNPGLYVAERENAEGTYFRGPAGTVSEWAAEYPGMSKTYDGGFWIPRDATKPPLIYGYFSVDSAPVAKPIEGADCSMATYTKDPASKKISVSLAATVGAAGGAAGRAMVPGSRVSYGQASAGGAIGAGIVALMINADVGKIILFPPLEDASFIAKLKAFSAQAVSLQEAPVAASAPAGADK